MLFLGTVSCGLPVESNLYTACITNVFSVSYRAWPIGHRQLGMFLY